MDSIVGRLATACGALASAPSVRVSTAPYPLAGAVAAEKGVTLPDALAEAVGATASLALWRSMVTTGEDVEAGLTLESITGSEPLKPVLQLVPVEPKGESDGAAGGGADDDAGRVWLAVARGAEGEADAGPAGLAPIPTPLSSSSIGSSRCA